MLKMSAAHKKIRGFSVDARFMPKEHEFIVFAHMAFKVVYPKILHTYTSNPFLLVQFFLIFFKIGKFQF